MSFEEKKKAIFLTIGKKKSKNQENYPRKIKNNSKGNRKKIFLIFQFSISLKMFKSDKNKKFIGENIINLNYHVQRCTIYINTEAKSGMCVCSYILYLFILSCISVHDNWVYSLLQNICSHYFQFNFSIDFHSNLIFSTNLVPSNTINFS